MGQRLLLGQHVPGGTGAIRPLGHVDWIQFMLEQFNENFNLSEHADLLGQHLPNGTGAIWPLGQRSTIQRTFEQTVIKHWSILGQH